MTFRYSDRVAVTASAPGTGAIPAASAALTGGFIQLSAIPSIATGDIIPYSIQDSANNKFEEGYGTWNSSTGLARTTVKTSSNAGAVETFSASCIIRCSAIAASLPLLDNSGNLSIGGNITAANFTGTSSVGVGATSMGSTGVTCNSTLGYYVNAYGFNAQVTSTVLNASYSGYVINHTSDERFKTILPPNAQPNLKNGIIALDIVLLDQYPDMEKAGEPLRRLAFTAQQARKALGPYISKILGVQKPKKKDGIWKVGGYTPWDGLSLWGIKDLYKENDAMRAEIKELRAHRKVTDRRMAAIEAELARL